MKNPLAKSFLAKTVVALCTFSAVLTITPRAEASDTVWMHGGNWSDERDNFVDGTLIPSGLNSSSRARHYRNTSARLAGFGEGIGMNLVRVAVNPATIANTGRFARWREMITTFKNEGFVVLLAYWEGDSSKDGEIDDYDDWQSMWETLDGYYRRDRAVYFEPFNEPHGYSSRDLNDIYEDFLSFTRKDNGFIVLDGTGYAQDVRRIGDNSDLDGCKLTLHVYSWFSTQTESGWRSYVSTRAGDYQDRTLITECGSMATSGRDFNDSSATSNSIRMIRGVTKKCRDAEMGFVCWPAWRNNDSFRLFDNTADDTLTNSSLKDRFRHAWGF